MKIQPTVDYLTEFFEEHIRDYREMMRDAGGSRHPEPYEGRSEAIQFIRNLVLGIEEEFADMAIPRAYPSPPALHARLVAYRDMASDQSKKVIDLNSDSGDHWFSELSHAYKISKEIEEAITYALTLSEISPPKKPALERLLHIVAALPKVARQLTKRRKDLKVSRPTLEINDEYDVQDLLHSLLHIEFSDVRNEEWTPSFAGSAKRTDFLLSPEKIVIEVKKTRPGSTQSGVAGELTIDIAAYKTHPKAEHLVCVVWDVDCILKNPTALKTDIEAANAGFVTVIVLR
ncbi:hypothetical protein GN109_12615 [Collimonas pratensis]|uniref:PD-(D/E)XK nuclease domain-containing protein n=1 Tax=Collimonas pratensis TaxID=279113 RepID=UPI00143CE5AE|nr:hypothetical protein [Collimonas pratensis]NKI70262.1 hypothetical protein [Collimonas pratensis]